MIVLQISAAMFAVVLVGLFARRRAWLDAGSTAALGRLVVDVAFPALVFGQLVRTVDAAALRASWYVPVAGAAVLLAGGLAGLALAPLVPRSRRTFVFLVAVTNWIFLPLPVAQALFGPEGVRTVLLFNAGAQAVLWTAGVWTLRGGRPDARTLRGLLLNPGLVATAGGLLVALAVPQARALVASPPGGAPALVAAKALFQAFELAGAMTVPLSLVVTGAQLGALPLSVLRPARDLALVLAGRLLLAPALVFAALHLVRVHAGLSPVAAQTVAIIAAMPCATSCGPFAARFGGDTELAARGVFATTLLGLATVPLAARLAAGL
jgi:hypothetical protein